VQRRHFKSLPPEYFYNAYVTLFKFDERVYVQPLTEHDSIQVRFGLRWDLRRLPFLASNHEIKSKKDPRW